METGAKYPDCRVKLTGINGNAVMIFRTVRRELVRYLKAQGWDPAKAEQEGDAFQSEATSGDYDNVLITCHRWVTVL